MRRVLRNRVRRELSSHASLVARLTLEAELIGHYACVNRLAWNASGTKLASISDDCTCVIWDMSRGPRFRVQTRIKTGHLGNIFGVAFVPATNDTCLATGAMDNQLRVLRVREHGVGVCARVYNCHSARVKHIAVHAMEGHVFWSASEDGTVAQIDVRTPPHGLKSEHPSLAVEYLSLVVGYLSLVVEYISLVVEYLSSSALPLPFILLDSVWRQKPVLPHRPQQG